MRQSAMRRKRTRQTRRRSLRRRRRRRRSFVPGVVVRVGNRERRERDVRR